jgi:tetratricopeptide (TPR) repeat protein
MNHVNPVPRGRGLTRSGRLILLLGGGMMLWTSILPATVAPTKFAEGLAACERKDFARAAEGFASLATNEPSFGVFLNLGNAEWQQGRTAAAILAWERAAQIDPFRVEAANNLQFARQSAQLESPDRTWYEATAAWLPAGWWAWLAALSFWLALAALLLPGVLRWRRSVWPQAAGAVGLGVFLLTLPANYGVWTRTALGVARQNETPLRLTPTATGEPATRLAAGEPGRVVRARGNFLLVETRRGRGWLTREEFGWLYGE